MLAVEVLLAGVECLVHHAVLQADGSHGAEALALDKDFTFLVLLRANLVAVEVVGTEVPLAVPSVFLHGSDHGVDVALGAGGLCLVCCGIAATHGTGGQLLAQLHILLADHDEEAGYHQALSLRALGLVFGGLEGLVGIP